MYVLERSGKLLYASYTERGIHWLWIPLSESKVQKCNLVCFAF